jgi:hypothetical protein
VYVSCAKPGSDPYGQNPYRAYLHASILSVAGLFPGVTQVKQAPQPPRIHLPCEPLSISYGHVGCLKARAFPPPV